MAWWFLFLAGVFEIGWAVGLKYTDGFTRFWPTAATAAALVTSMGLLAVALRHIPLGTAYAVWTGIGAVGAVVLGILLFGEPAGAGRIACLALIVSGIIGLKVLTPAVPDDKAADAAAAPAAGGRGV